MVHGEKPKRVRWWGFGRPVAFREILLLVVIAPLSLIYALSYTSLAFRKREAATPMKIVIRQPIPIHDRSRYETVDAFDKRTDVPSLITLGNYSDVLERRKQVIGFVWGRKGFPSRQPTVEAGVRGPGLGNAEQLLSVDRLTVSMDYGLTSVAYLFHPVNERDHLLMYHEGHRKGFLTDTRVIDAALRNGFPVLALAMPLKGMNPRPSVVLERFGCVRLDTHEQMKFLEDPIRFFVEPVCVCLNTLERRYGRVSMLGFSGGGWTTTLCAAIDPRIQRSYPAAGSLPICFRWTTPITNVDWGDFEQPSSDWGDFEQTVPDLYRIANYPELYVMGSVGESRKQVQIINEYDEACFGGVRYTLYEGAVAAKAKALGGAFSVYLDRGQRKHMLSDRAIRMVIQDLLEAEADRGRG